MNKAEDAASMAVQLHIGHEGNLFTPSQCLFIHRICSHHARDYHIDDPQLFLHSLRQQCKQGFSNIDLPLSLFIKMTSLHPLPSIVHFNQLVAAMIKVKPRQNFSTIISLYRQLELSGLRPDMHSLGILANCYSSLGHVDFCFSRLAKRLKLGYPLNAVIFTILINGFIHADKLDQAVDLLRKMVKLGFHPNIVTHSAMVKGLCKRGNNVGAVKLLGKMERGFCEPDVVIYNTIIDSLCKDKLLNQALNLFSHMKSKGLSPTAVTYSALIRGMCNLGRCSME